MWLDLKLGSRGPEVGSLQRFLNMQGASDANGEPLVDDEILGPRSSAAIRNWQGRNTLKPTGVFGQIERVIARAGGFVPFVQARHATILHPSRAREIDLIVIHTMENPEKPGQAENVGFWFASAASPQASAHYGVDPDNVVQYVRDWDVAWHAPGANDHGIGIEHAGYSSQNGVAWADEPSLRILDRSAKLAAELAVRYGIPIVHRTEEELRAGGHVQGFCGHVDVTHAFPGPKRDHYDPGPSYPWDTYLDLVRTYAQRL